MDWIFKNGGWSMAQAVAVVGMIAYGVYFNSQDVPKLREKIVAVEKAVGILEATQPLILQSLERIERKVDRR